MEGQSFSYFRIVSKIGQGGMGEVWEATDTKLNRRVALKLLPELFAHDSQRMGRFQREAQVLASLNHPNIAAIYGLEDADGKKALVMELIEGEELSAHIARSPLPLEQAAGMALQIAKALESAHDKGIIHRDLKPANVKITPEGTVKVLDFGLAKAMENDPSSSPELTQSPTLSLAATQAGVILGTAAYMSPEQARGKTVDRRADIWAFGAVLFEMLSGRKAFEGEDLSLTLASVMTREPAWQSLPASLPRAISNLLRRCLEKDPTLRLQSIGEARIVLESFLADPAKAEVEASPEAPVVRRGDKWWKIATAALFCGVLALGGAWFLAPDEVGESYSLEANFDGEGPFLLGYGASTVYSPGGRMMAYSVGVGNNPDSNRLYLRSLDLFESKQVDGGLGGYHPFFSPDGRWLGYVTRTELKKVAITGGAPFKLCDVDRSRGASWGENGLIVIAPSVDSPLFTVAAAGGELEELTLLEEGERSHRWPQFLPGSEYVLFTARRSDAEEISLKVVNVNTKEQKVVYSGGTFGRYLRSGHLLFWREGTVFAVPFNLKTMSLEGTPVPVIQGVRGNLEGGAQFDVSDTGNLVYLRGEMANADDYAAEFTWLGRDGETESLKTARAISRYGFDLSPDGRRVVGSRETNGNVDLWVHDLDRGTNSRITFADGIEGSPLWSPDGKYVFYTGGKDGVFKVTKTRADGSGDSEVVSEGREFRLPTSISSDGKYLIAAIGRGANGPTAATDAWVISLEGKEEPRLLFTTELGVFQPKISPDGQWLAYISRETGDNEVYVRPFAKSTGKWQISSGGGTTPHWTADGRKLVYLSPGGIMEVDLETDGEALRAGVPRLVVSRPPAMASSFSLSPDSSHFLILGNADGSGDGSEGSPMRNARITLNWYPALEAMLGND